MNHHIHIRTSEITEVDIPENDVDEENVNLKVEDREEKKEEDDDLVVSDKDVNGNIDDNEEDRSKRIKEVITHSWEEVKSEQTPCNTSTDGINRDKYKGLYRSLTKQDDANASSHIPTPQK